MKIALISDELTRASLAEECSIVNITPFNYKVALRVWRPDLLFVESAWSGHRNAWKYKIASYPDVPARSNNSLIRVVEYAKKLGIPTVFWNKEDSVHFDRFIDSAKLFDNVLTVDVNALPRYRSILDSRVHLDVMMFAVQKKFHFFNNDLCPTRSTVSFVGSYGSHVHPRRRYWQQILFEGFSATGISVYDRNSNRANDVYRYPRFPNLEVLPQVSFKKTAKIYRRHLASLNVNTVEDSETMFSRRLIEIIGCGSLAISSPALSVSKLFEPYCQIIKDKNDAENIASRLSCSGLSKIDVEMVREGAEYVANNHTWTHRLQQLKELC